MSFFTNRKSIEQKVCSKRTIQGGIEKFATKQTADDVFYSKNRPKQGKLDKFLKRKNSPEQACTSKRQFTDRDSLSAKHTTFSSQNLLKSTSEIVQSIIIDSDSSSDSYHTAQDDEYHTAPCSQNEFKNIMELEKENKSPEMNSIVFQPNCSSSLIEKKEEIQSASPAKKDTFYNNLFVLDENKNANKLMDIETTINDTLNNEKITSPLSLSKHSAISTIPNKYSKSDLKSFRFKVVTVKKSEKNDQIILAKHEQLQQEILFQLSNEWEDTHLDPDDNINIIPDDDIQISEIKQVIQVNRKDNLLVTHPSLLISGTTVSNALGCLRRAVLSERFKNTEFADCDDVSSVMLVGTIVHSIFQRAIKDKALQNKSSLMKLAKDMVFDSCYLADIVSVNSTQNKILKEVMEYLPQIENWILDFCRPRPLPNAGKVNMKYKKTNEEKVQRYSANVALTQVIDIEENIWSPRYGLKGKIDVTGRFKIKDQQTKKEIEAIMPVEIKTGKSTHSMEHHVQVAIYSMFCDERRNRNRADEKSIAAGLLLYLKSNGTGCESLSRADQCGILSLRNRIAHYLVKALLPNKDPHGRVAPFPPTTSNTRICGMCSQLRNCSLVYKSIDEPQSSFSPSADLSSMMRQHVSHLSSDDLAYFKHWMACIFLEAKEAALKDKQSKFWEKSPKERELNGHCITGLKLANAPVTENGIFLQTFKSASPTSKAVFEINEMVLVSGSEPSFIAMASGVVKEISNDFITVETERDFTHYSLHMQYSIDRHVWGSNRSTQSSLSNLSMMMNNDSQCDRLRNLIIHHREPSFRSDLSFLPRSSKDEIGAMLRGLNRTQRQAIKRVLLSNDYTLVVGMPGSGKTTTIVAMIRILLLCNLRVLVTSYTHSAVDNLLLKLVKYKVKFLRLGRLSMIHPNIKPFAEQHLSRDFTDPNQLRNLYKEARIVGCTCLAVTSHLLFSVPGQSRPLFDVCIVDEASQISQPVCLSPLMYASRFVLVGDHQQLPPLVLSQEAKDMGAEESLFRRLTRHRSALCELTLQYRMNSEIMGLSNHVTYQGRLECAGPLVAEAKLRLHSWKQIESEIPDSEKWLIETSKPDTSLIFLDTSAILPIEKIDVENKLEAKIVSRITECLIKSGCSPNNIGVIAPFRKQVQLLENMLSDSGVEVNTVDKYQGRDKSVILLSFVKSRDSGCLDKKGELLSDWRRLNVAVTRAKHKLVMVGCVPTLRQYQPCKKLLDYLREKHFITSLQTGF